MPHRDSFKAAGLPAAELPLEPTIPLEFVPDDADIDSDTIYLDDLPLVPDLPSDIEGDSDRIDDILTRVCLGGIIRAARPYVSLDRLRDLCRIVGLGQPLEEVAKSRGITYQAVAQRRDTDLKILSKIATGEGEMPFRRAIVEKPEPLDTLVFPLSAEDIEILQLPEVRKELNLLQRTNIILEVGMMTKLMNRQEMRNLLNTRTYEYLLEKGNTLLHENLREKSMVVRLLEDFDLLDGIGWKGAYAREDIEWLIADKYLGLTPDELISNPDIRACVVFLKDVYQAFGQVKISEYYGSYGAMAEV